MDIRLKASGGKNIVLRPQALPAAYPTRTQSAARVAVYWRFASELRTAARLIGVYAPGAAVDYPVAMDSDEDIILSTISYSARGIPSVRGLQDALEAYVYVQRETEAPLIGQVGEASGALATVGVDEFNRFARKRKVRVADNPDMTDATEYVSDSESFTKKEMPRFVDIERTFPFTPEYEFTGESDPASDGWTKTGDGVAEAAEDGWAIRTHLAALDLASLGSLELWLDADALALADGASVSTWTDRSGHARHATQGTAGSRPIFKTGIVNGRAVVRFDGTDDHLSLPSFTMGTICVVAKYNSANFTDYDGLFTGQSNTDHEMVFIGNSGSSAWYPNAAVARFVDGASSQDAIPTLNQFNIYTATDAAGLTASGYYVGRDRAQATRIWDGDIAEVIVFSTVLSASDRAKVENYLRTKYGISGGMQTYYARTLPSTPFSTGFTLDMRRPTVEATDASAPSQCCAIRIEDGAHKFELTFDADELRFQGGTSRACGASANVRLVVAAGGATADLYIDGSLVESGVAFVATASYGVRFGDLETTNDADVIWERIAYARSVQAPSAPATLYVTVAHSSGSMWGAESDVLSITYAAEGAAGGGSAGSFDPRPRQKFQLID
jgi:hypothetical protein